MALMPERPARSDSSLITSGRRCSGSNKLKRFMAPAGGCFLALIRYIMDFAAESLWTSFVAW